MGGRYGSSDDGSDDYQSRQPDDDDLADEQQTVADAVQSVAEQYHNDSESKSESDGASQRERDREETRDRADEAAPVHDAPTERLGALDEALETHDYPTTTDELIAAYGDYEVETQGGSKSITEVLAPIDNETYDSAVDVRNRIQGLIHR
jgi:hypothetical protein